MDFNASGVKIGVIWVVDLIFGVTKAVGFKIWLLTLIMVAQKTQQF